MSDRGFVRRRGPEMPSDPTRMQRISVAEGRAEAYSRIEAGQSKQFAELLVETYEGIAHRLRKEK